MMFTKIISIIHTWGPLLIQGMLMTMIVSCCGLAIGLCGGTLFGIGSCRKLKTLWTPLINFYTLVIRGTPVYVQLLIVYYALPELININLGPLQAGIIVLGFNSIAYVAEIIRSGINAVPGGQWDAAYVLGYPRIKTLTLIILPQAFKNILPALINEIIALIKESSILASIGLLEITRVAMNITAQTLDPLGAYLCVAMIYLFLTTTISFFAKKIEKKMEFAHDHN